MKKRILESEEKLLVDDDGIIGKSDPLDNLEKDDLYSHYSDLYKEKHNIRPRWVHPSDVSVEELRRMIDDLYQDPDYSDDEDDYSDREDNKEYFDDLDAKSSEDSEIEDLAGLGPEDGEEFHTFAGMGKGRHGRNRIHEVTPQQTKYVSPVPKKPRSFWRMMFPGLADEIDLFTGNHTKEIKKHYQNQSAEADRERIKREREAQQNKEDEIRREKNYQDQKAARAASDEKYRGMNRDQRDQAYLDSKGKRIQTDYENGRFVKTVVPIKENRTSNKITIGQLRQIIKEELENVYFNNDNLDEGWKQTLAAGALGAATLFGAGNASAASHDHAKPEQHQVQKQQKDQKQLVKQVKNVINNANLKQLKDIAQFCSRIKGTNIEIMNLSSMNEDELRDLINKVPDGTEKIKAVDAATGFMKNPNAFWANTIW